MISSDGVAAKNIVRRNRKAAIQKGYGASERPTLEGVTILSFALRLSGDSVGGISNTTPAT